jgi:hypothetical protein
MIPFECFCCLLFQYILFLMHLQNLLRNLDLFLLILCLLFSRFLFYLLCLYCLWTPFRIVSSCSFWIFQSKITEFRFFWNFILGNHIHLSLLLQISLIVFRIFVVSIFFVKEFFSEFDSFSWDLSCISFYLLFYNLILPVIKSTFFSSSSDSFIFTT